MWHATDNGLYRTAQGDEDLEAAKIRRCVSISTLQRMYVTAPCLSSTVSGSDVDHEC